MNQITQVCRNNLITNIDKIQSETCSILKGYLKTTKQKDVKIYMLERKVAHLEQKEKVLLKMMTEAKIKEKILENEIDLLKTESVSHAIREDIIKEIKIMSDDNDKLSTRPDENEIVGDLNNLEKNNQERNKDTSSAEAPTLCTESQSFQAREPLNQLRDRKCYVNMGQSIITVPNKENCVNESVMNEDVASNTTGEDEKVIKDAETKKEEFLRQLVTNQSTRNIHSETETNNHHVSIIEDEKTDKIDPIDDALIDKLLEDDDEMEESFNNFEETFSNLKVNEHIDIEGQFTVKRKRKWSGSNVSRRDDLNLQHDLTATLSPAPFRSTSDTNMNQGKVEKTVESKRKTEILVNELRGLIDKDKGSKHFSKPQRVATAVKTMSDIRETRGQRKTTPKSAKKLTLNQGEFSIHDNTVSLGLSSKKPNIALKAMPKKTEPLGRHKTMRKKNCGSCLGCLSPECEKCRNCLDKPKFGGSNRIKQKCVLRKCRNFQMKNDETRLKLMSQLI